MFNKTKFSFIAAAIMILPQLASAAAMITIVNGDPAGVGFNDATVVAQVGGNTGTTLGQQRLNAFQSAANKWGATLTSSITIRVYATWEALTCTATSAVLGSAGATQIYRDFANAGVPGVWYGKALANKQTGVDLDLATADIRARFNVNLGNAGCLTGTSFYLGLDNNHSTNVDLVTVLTHEFGHGLGFQTFTNGSTGTFQSGFPSIWDQFLLDTSTSKTWSIMSDAERAASALKVNKLVWNGANVTASIPTVLSAGVPQLNVGSPASVAGTYLVGTAAFGSPLPTAGLTAEVMPAVDTAGNFSMACTALSPINAAAVVGKIVLLDRGGGCAFTVKVKNAQNAGALGAIIADNVAGSPPAGLGGTDATITIPSVRITQADGVLLKAALAGRSRSHSGMFATLITNLAVRQGADSSNRALMYTPNPFQSGSSVSHFDISAFPNQLMEPSINGDLTHEVTTPQDLTYKLLLDIGWQ